jgi:hypothetical protein
MSNDKLLKILTGAVRSNKPHSNPTPEQKPAKTEQKPQQKPIKIDSPNKDK